MSRSQTPTRWGLPSGRLIPKIRANCREVSLICELPRFDRSLQIDARERSFMEMQLLESGRYYLLHGDQLQTWVLPKPRGACRQSSDRNHFEASACAGRHPIPELKESGQQRFPWAPCQVELPASGPQGRKWVSRAHPEPICPLLFCPS